MPQIWSADFIYSGRTVFSFFRRKFKEMSYKNYWNGQKRIRKIPYNLYTRTEAAQKKFNYLKIFNILSIFLFFEKVAQKTYNFLECGSVNHLNWMPLIQYILDFSTGSVFQFPKIQVWVPGSKIFKKRFWVRVQYRFGFVLHVWWKYI